MVGMLLAGACAAAAGAEPVPMPATPPSTTPAALETPRIAPDDLHERLGDADVVVLDVRTAAEFEAGHVPGAHNVPHDQVKQRLGELAAWKDRDVVLYCRSGRRSGLAAQVLREAGFERLRQLEGDYPAWEASKLPVESGDAD